MCTCGLQVPEVLARFDVAQERGSLINSPTQPGLGDLLRSLESHTIWRGVLPRRGSWFWKRSPTCNLVYIHRNRVAAASNDDFSTGSGVNNLFAQCARKINMQEFPANHDLVPASNDRRLLLRQHLGN